MKKQKQADLPQQLPNLLLLLQLHLHPQHLLRVLVQVLVSVLVKELVQALMPLLLVAQSIGSRLLISLRWLQRLQIWVHLRKLHLLRMLVQLHLREPQILHSHLLHRRLLTRHRQDSSLNQREFLLLMKPHKTAKLPHTKRGLQD